MIKLILVVSFFSSFAFAEYVNGYTRKNGTYVPGYNRSDRNDTKNDNYSTKGNYNPYTGAKGTKDGDDDGY